MGCQTEVEVGANLTFTVAAHNQGTGALADADSVPDYRIYEDETGTPILTGSMALLDDAGTLGFYSELISASTGNGFEAGKSYSIYTTIVVAGVTYAVTYGLRAVTLADVIWDEALTGATHNVATSAGRRLRSIQDFGIYDMGSVWVDEVAGTSSGTVDGEDATVTNRADDFDNAQTIAASVDLDAIHIQNGNTITLAATLNGFNLWSGGPPGGNVWALVLAGRDIGLSSFLGATVNGIATGTTPIFRDCDIEAATLPPARLVNCLLHSTLTMGSAGEYHLIDCRSGVAGAGAPVIDMGGAVGATTLELRDWRGGITLNNLASGDMITLDGIFGTITLNGADAEVEIRGIWKAVVDNLTGAPTVTKSGVEGTDLADVLEDTGTTLPTEHAALPTAIKNRQEIDSNSTGLAAIKAVTDVIPDSGAMTTIGADTARLTAARAAVLTDWINDGRLDLILDAILAMLDDARGEPAQGKPPVNPDMATKMDWLYSLLVRNLRTQTATEEILFADDGTTEIAKRTVSSDGTTLTKGEMATGT